MTKTIHANDLKNTIHERDLEFEKLMLKHTSIVPVWDDYRNRYANPNVILYYIHYRATEKDADATFKLPTEIDYDEGAFTLRRDIGEEIRDFLVWCRRIPQFYVEYREKVKNA